MKMINEKMVKIQTIKQQLKQIDEDLIASVQELTKSVATPLNGTTQTAEGSSEDTGTINALTSATTVKETIASLKATKSDLKKQLELERMNKTGSSFFSFIPNPGMNRESARRFRKIRHLIKPDKDELDIRANAETTS